jgi:hypothetical protein
LIQDRDRLISEIDEVLQLLAVPSSTEDPRYFRASQRVRPALDSLQIYADGRWRRSIQAASVLVALIAALLIQLSRTGESRWLFILSAALIGGPLAWTIRDVTAAVERWRR